MLDTTRTVMVPCQILRLCVVSALLATGCSSEAAYRRSLEAGERFMKAGEVRNAIIEFRSAVEHDEQAGEARFKLGEAYAANGQPERAYREYVRAADLLPDDVPAQLKAAAYLLLVGQYEDARTRATRLLEKHPQNVEALILFGNALAGLRDLDGAVAQLKDAIEIEPGRSQSYTNLALLNVAQGRRDEARQAFEKAVATDPASIPAHLALANFQWSVGDTAAAERSLQAAFALDGNHVLTNRALATFYVASGRAEAAEPYLKTAAAANTSTASQFELADYYILARRTADAIRVLEPMTADAGTASQAEVRLAGLAYLAGQTADANARIDRLLRREPNNALALLFKARWLMAEGRLERALARATAAIAADPRMVGAHYIRGQLQAATHRSADAIKSFGEVLRLNPRAAIAQVQLSRLHLARNSVDSAVLVAEEALRNAPDSLDAKLALTRAWLVRNDLERVAVGLEQLRRQAPTVAAVHTLDGLLRAQRNDIRGARASFERALALDLLDVEALAWLTQLDLRQGQVAVARARVESTLAAAARSPLTALAENPDLLLVAGRVYAADGDSTAAERVLRRAIEVDPLHMETFALLGRVYADQKRLDDARREFDELARQQPDNVAARLMSAIVVHTQGDLAGATTRYEEILKIEPRTTIAANNLASIYAEAGENLDIAERWAEVASEQMPLHAGVQDTLGMVYYRRQQYLPALQRFQQSVTLAPDNAVYRYHLAMVYAKNGEVARARESLRLALDRNPDYTDARQMLASLNN